MPEVYFQIQWPDGEVTRCYSPSTVVQQYFETGMTMRVDELISRSSEALDRAGDRVQGRYGYRCSSAAAQLDEIVARARAFRADEAVRVLSVEQAG